MTQSPAKHFPLQRYFSPTRSPPRQKVKVTTDIKFDHLILAKGKGKTVFSPLVSAIGKRADCSDYCRHEQEQKAVKKWGKVLEKQEGPGCSQKLPGPMLIAFTEFSNGLILFFFTFPQLPPIPI